MRFWRFGTDWLEKKGWAGAVGLGLPPEIRQPYNYAAILTLSRRASLAADRSYMGCPSEERWLQVAGSILTGQNFTHRCRWALDGRVAEPPGMRIARH